MNILTIGNISDKVVSNLLTKWVRDLKIGQNTVYLAYVLMAKIGNISNKVVSNLLTKWVRDLKIGQNTGYLAYVLMANQIGIKHTKWHSHNMQYFR